MTNNDLFNTDGRRVIATRDTDFQPHRRYGTPNPDLHWLPLSQDEHCELYLVRIAPDGASSPHEHVGYEEFMVLDGELQDCDGQVFKPGDFVSYPPGTKHYSRSRAGCTLLVLTRGGSNRAISR